MVKVELPVLDKITGWGLLDVPTIWPEKVSESAERLAAGPMPVPWRLISCGLSGALSEIVSVPSREPGAAGAKATVSVQRVPDPRVAGDRGQLFVWEKSPVTNDDTKSYCWH